MHSLPLNAISNWQAWNNLWLPTSVDTLCPHCGRMVNLTLEQITYDAPRRTAAANARCPGCSKHAHLWILRPGDAHDSSKRGCDVLCIFPKPRLARRPIVADGTLSPALARAYHSALAAYNAGLWAPCAASCRRTLEGLIKTLNKDSTGSLFTQLKELPSKVDLAEPIVCLAENLRKGGNIAAHFDLEREPDQHVAEAMVDLLDYLIEYIYVLKAKALELETRLDSLSKNSVSTTNGQ